MYGADADILLRARRGGVTTTWPAIPYDSGGRATPTKATGSIVDLSKAINIAAPDFYLLTCHKNEIGRIGSSSQTPYRESEIQTR